MRTNLNEVPKSPMPPRPTVHRERKSGTAQDYEARLRAEQRLGKGILGGFAAALAGGVLWAFISAVTHFQIIYMAVGVALGVAWSLRRFGK